MKLKTHKRRKKLCRILRRMTALDGMDVLKHHSWYVSGPACGLGTGRRSHCNDRLCAWAYCQIPGEAGHVFPQDNKKERL